VEGARFSLVAPNIQKGRKQSESQKCGESNAGGVGPSKRRERVKTEGQGMGWRRNLGVVGETRTRPEKETEAPNKRQTKRNSGLRR